MGHENFTMSFRDQMVFLGQLWSTWSEVEQVVAVYSFIKKMNPIPMKFMLSIITSSTTAESTDLLTAETRANDPNWVTQIQDTKDNLANELLHHLPLLRANNNEAKLQYLHAIPKVLTNAVTQPASAATLEKARQLLSYSLIHPAVSVEERKSLIQWLRALEDKLADLKKPTSYLSEGNSGLWGNVDSTPKTRWSESPISTNGPNELGPQDDHKWHIGSLADAPPSPNNSGTSGSESTSEEPPHYSPHPGMKDVGAWLKSLRLHKYTQLLSSLTYDELLALDEDTLENKGVTKGARHKIVLSIAKLKERHKQLINLEKDLMKEGNVSTALNELRYMILTPMPPVTPTREFTQSNNPTLTPAPDPPPNLKDRNPTGTPTEEDSPSDPKTGPEEDGDLPSRFTRVVGKVCTQLLVSVQPEDEAVSNFLGLVDKCLNHESFNPAHAKRLLTWKQQILRIWHPLPPKSKDGRHMRRWSQQYGGDSIGGSFRSSRMSQQRYGGTQMTGLLVPGKSLHNAPSPHHHPLFTIPTNATSLGGILTPRNSLPGIPSLSVASLLTPQQFLAKRPSLQEVPSELRPHTTLHRTRSAPSRPHQLPATNPSRQIPQNNDARPPGPPPVMGGSSANSSCCSSGSSNASSRSNSGPTDLPKNPTQGFGSTQSSSVLVNHSSHNDTSGDADITDQLESLCLSMTEHALG